MSLKVRTGNQPRIHPAKRSTSEQPTGSPRWLIYFIVASCLGPYVAPGLRTEQLVIYLLAAAYAFFRWNRVRARTGLSQVSTAWIAYTTLILASTALNSAAPPDLSIHGVEAGSILAGVDNLLLPLVILAFVRVAAAEVNPTSLIGTAANAILLAGIVAAGLSAAQAFASLDLSLWAGGELTSTAENAAQNGRFGGAFNQPAEAGLFFGIVLLTAVFSITKRPILGTLGTIAAIVGGFLAVSKVLMFVAIPLAIWQAIDSGKSRAARTIIAVGAIWASLALTPASAIPDWPGAQQLRTVLESFQQNPLRAASAGRVGEDSTLISTINPVRESSSLLGFGAGGIALPYDNAWVESFVVGGALGVALLTLVLTSIGLLALRAPRSKESALLRALTALTIASCLGLPALTANRASTILWLAIALLIANQFAIDRDERVRTK